MNGEDALRQGLRAKRRAAAVRLGFAPTTDDQQDAVPRGNAGEGQAGPPPRDRANMNDLIRRKGQCRS